MKVIDGGPAASSVAALLILFRVPFNTAETPRLRQRRGASRAVTPTRSPSAGVTSALITDAWGENTAINKAACTQGWRNRFVFRRKRARKRRVGPSTRQQPAGLQPWRRHTHHLAEHKSRRGGPDLPRPAGAPADSCWTHVSAPKPRRVCRQLCAEGTACCPTRVTLS